MKFHLIRKPSGALIVNRSLNAQYAHIQLNFDTAVYMFGHLCKPGEAINGAEWERRILERHWIGNVAPFIDAIRACMDSYRKEPKVAHPPFGWPFVKSLFKDFFFPKKRKQERVANVQFK